MFENYLPQAELVLLIVDYEKTFPNGHGPLARRLEPSCLRSGPLSRSGGGLHKNSCTLTVDSILVMSKEKCTALSGFVFIIYTIIHSQMTEDCASVVGCKLQKRRIVLLLVGFRYLEIPVRCLWAAISYVEIMVEIALDLGFRREAETCFHSGSSTVESIGKWVLVLNIVSQYAPVGRCAENPVIRARRRGIS